jgi:hypothetical protein
MIVPWIKQRPTNEHFSGLRFGSQVAAQNICLEKVNTLADSDLQGVPSQA